MSAFIIKNATIITMDPQRRVLEGTAVAIQDDRIAAMGEAQALEAQYPHARVINAHKKALMPGLVDGHIHAGHAMIKTMGDGNGEEWYECVRKFYTEGATTSFWKADARLTALDRLKNGITTAMVYFGGGDAISRVDDPVHALEHLKSVKEVGVREFLAVGSCRPPFPTGFVHWQNGKPEKNRVSFQQQLDATEEVIRSGHLRISDRLRVCLTLPVYGRDPQHFDMLAELKGYAEKTRDLYKKYGLLFTQDGHRSGSIKFQHEHLNLGGTDALFSHSINLTDEEIDLCAEMGTRIIHNPSAVASIRGRCPVTELIDKGVIVLLGSDSAAPDRGCDMFRHMFHAMHYHRTFFKDENVLPPGKVLEMCTIDAARALGMQDEIGSIEVGKKADLILVDMRKPHLYPYHMIPSRLAYFAHGSDVDTVIVDGEVLMENRVVNTVNEDDVLDEAQAETEAILSRTGTRQHLEFSENYWGRSHY